MNKLEAFLNKYIFSRLFSNSETQKIANNSLWIISDRLIRISLGLISGVWVARYLGPDNFGKLSFVTSFIMFFAPLSTLTMDAIIVKHLARNPDMKNAILGSSLFLRLTASVIAIILACIASVILRPGDTLILKMVFIISSCFLFQSFDVIDLFFQSLLKSKYTMYAKTSAYILFSFIKIGMVLLHAPFMAFVWAFFGEIAISSIGILVLYLIKNGSIFNWFYNKRVALILLGGSFFLIIQNFATVLQNKVDLLIIGTYLPDNELGQYSVAMRMVEMASFIPYAISASYLARLAEAKNGKHEAYLIKLSNYYRIIFYAFLPIGVGSFFFGRDFINLFFGKEYDFSGIIFSLSVVKILNIYVGYSKSFYYVNENMQRHSMICIISGGIANLIAGIILIPRYHAYGGIMAGIISFIVSFFVVDLFNAKARNNLIFFMKSIFTIGNK